MEDVEAASRAAQEFCLKHDAGNRGAMLTGLFLEEMAKNVLQNAERKKLDNVRVDFRLYYNKGRISFSIMDLSDQFDPTLFYQLHSDDAPEAHSGIRMVTRMSKEVRYYDTFKSNNLVVYLN